MQQQEREEGGLRAVLHAVENTAMEPAVISPLTHAPLVERAPEQMPEIVRRMHDTVAKSLEDAADALEAEMQSKVQLMRDEAQSLRAQGESQAISIEQLSTVLRDANRVFRSEADKLMRFRAGIAAAA